MILIVVMEAFPEEMLAWKKIVSVILSNRCPEDVAFLNSYGDYLAQKGECEAAHLCFLSSQLNWAAPNPLGKIELLNANSILWPFTFFKDWRALRLTEIMEAALIATGTTTSSPLPHFQAYKLIHAAYLADIGLIAEAANFMESTTTVCKGLPPLSPFIHQVFGDKIKELYDRLVSSSAAKIGVSKNDSNESWIGKIGNNFTGAAFGRGLEVLMNSAVGVDEEKRVQQQGTNSLFTVPGIDVKPDVQISSFTTPAPQFYQQQQPQQYQDPRLSYGQQQHVEEYSDPMLYSTQNVHYVEIFS